MQPAALEVAVITNLRFSETRGKLFEARAAAQKKIKAIKKESVNPFFKSKYADLQAQIEATADAIAEQGLCIIQSPLVNGEKAGVTTVLGHSSGEWMQGDLLLPVAKWDAQGIGSAITYARRYARQSFLDVSAETDDDANAASGKDAKEAAMPRPPARQTQSTAKPNGDPFKVKFWRTAKATGKTDEAIRDYIGGLGYEHTEEIPPQKHQEALAWAGGTQ